MKFNYGTWKHFAFEGFIRECFRIWTNDNLSNTLNHNVIPIQGITLGLRAYNYYCLQYRNKTDKTGHMHGHTKIKDWKSLTQLFFFVEGLKYLDFFFSSMHAFLDIL